MARQRVELDRVEGRLIQAHAQRPQVELSPQWQRGLMSEVLQMGAQAGARLQRAGNGFTAAFTGLLFRFAGVGALVAAGLLIYTLAYGPDLEAQAAVLVMEQPVPAASLESLLGS